MKDKGPIVFDPPKNNILTSTEEVYFDLTIKDTHGCSDLKYTYTIPVDGKYHVIKKYKAGDVIELPEMVRRV